MIIYALMQTVAEAVQHTVAPAAQGASESIKPIFIGATVIMYVQRWLKTRDWYKTFVHLVPGSDKWAHRLIAAIGSIWVGLGIHITYTGTLMGGGHAGVDVPALQNMLQGVYDTGGLFALQQMFYEATRSTTPVAEARAEQGEPQQSGEHEPPTPPRREGRIFS